MNSITSGNSLGLLHPWNFARDFTLTLCNVKLKTVVITLFVHISTFAFSSYGNRSSVVKVTAMFSPALCYLDPCRVVDDLTMTQSTVYITKTLPFKLYWKFYHQKWNFSEKKNQILFHTSAKNIDCGHSLEPPRRGGSNEYPQSMFLSRIRKIMNTPCKPQFYYMKVGFKGIKII